jgi:hypothetical protein
VIRAGSSRIRITPPAGVPLAGFAAREGVSTGVHDDLYVRALVVERDGAAVAFASVDVLALAAPFVRRVRAAIAGRTALTPERVLIASTHTHAGPVTISTFFNPGAPLDDAYMTELAAAIEESVVRAWRDRHPARVGVGTTRVDGIGVNRRSPDKRPVDNEVGLIKVEDERGRPRALLLDYTCHPTVLGPDNLLVTGDYPAFALQRIEQAFGDGAAAMFVNGAQGNISVGHSSELSAIGVITPGRTFERATELGHRLADAALAALPSIAANGDLPIASAVTTAPLPLKRYPPLDETSAALAAAERKLADASAQPPEVVGPLKTGRLYASIHHYYNGLAQQAPNGILPIEVQGLRIGNALLVGVPAEVFVEIGLEAKSRAAHPLFIAGISNGYIGYLPHRDAYSANGYEVVAARCTEDGADRLLAAIASLDERLFASAIDHAAAGAGGSTE